MNKQEIETTIIINKADLADGFFTIGTNDPKRLREIKRKCPNLLPTRTSKDPHTNTITWFEFKIPAKRCGRLPIKSIPNPKTTQNLGRFSTLNKKNIS